MAIEEREIEENFKRLFPQFYQKMEEMLNLKCVTSAPNEASKAKYTKAILFRTSEEDHSTLNRAANKAKRSLSNYMRLLIHKHLHG